MYEDYDYDPFLENHHKYEMKQLISGLITASLVYIGIGIGVLFGVILVLGFVSNFWKSSALAVILVLSTVAVIVGTGYVVIRDLREGIEEIKKEKERYRKGLEHNRKVLQRQ